MRDASEDADRHIAYGEEPPIANGDNGGRCVLAAAMLNAHPKIGLALGEKRWNLAVWRASPSRCILTRKARESSRIGSESPAMKR